MCATCAGPADADKSQPMAGAADVASAPGRDGVKTSIEPRTEALRRALAACGESSAADLAFLEAWEADPVPGLGAALRVAQIRRANPALAAAIRAELEVRAHPPTLTPRRS